MAKRVHSLTFVAGVDGVTIRVDNDTLSGQFRVEGPTIGHGGTTEDGSIWVVEISGSDLAELRDFLVEVLGPPSKKG